MTKNNPEAVKLVEQRVQELIRCARMCAESEIKMFSDGIEITVNGIITTPLMRAAVSLQECYPDGGVYVVSRLGVLMLCVYYKMED